MPAGGLTSGSHPARLLVRATRAMWLRDRGVVEARWAALTLVAMTLLAAAARALEPTETGFDRAMLVDGIAAAVAIALGWSEAGGRFVRRPVVRWLLGPTVLAIAMLGTGPMAADTLRPPPAAPLVVLAFTFSAITRGYPIAAALMALAWLIGGIAYVPGMGAAPGDDLRDEYLVGGAVALLAATGMHLVVRVATEAEARAQRLAARTRARVDALERLERVVRGFDGTRPIGETIQGVVDDVSREFDITLVSMYLPDGDGRLTMVGVAGYHSPFHVIDMGVGIIGRAGVTRATQFVPDVLDDPDYRAARDDVRSEVAAPIVYDGELLGVINFEGTLARPMTSTHVALAEMLARSIATGLRAARLDEERRARLHAIERVLEVSRGLVGELDRPRTVGAVVEAAADLLGADAVAIAGRDADGRLRVEHELTAAPGGAHAGRVLGEGDRPAIEAVERGEPVTRTVGGVEGGDDRTVLALPIRIGDAVAAVLIASRPASAPGFGAVDRRIADLLVTQVAIALGNAARHATVSDAAVRDPLTGLLNRRYFDEAVETAFAAARRNGSPLSLIVLDLDRFSAVNNEHGHATGDAVLRRVARAIAGAVRVGDTVARYGGEEFVVIAPDTSADAAVAVAERVRDAVAASTAADWSSTSGSAPDGAATAITVSAGVASLLGDELDGQALFRAADSALLAAKRAGRDRVVAV